MLPLFFLSPKRRRRFCCVGLTMMSVPYPVFVKKTPVNTDKALIAVGRCRIHPETCTLGDASEYRAIVNKCIEQANEDGKTTRKKYMKQGVAIASAYLMDTLKLDVSVVDVQVLVTADDLLKSDGCLASCLLDAGCQAIVTDGNNLQAMDAANIPRERLVAHFSSPPTEDDVAATSPLASIVSVSVNKASNEELISILKLGDDKNVEIVIEVHPNECEELATMIGGFSKQGTIALVDPTATQLGLSYAACMKTDRPDGLFTTVVCTRAGEALGLVYSSKESIVAALECGRGVYYSRSRGGLWRKGDTSGHYQDLHRLDVDCDGDALRFTVTQRGDDTAAFCHLNTLTCWGEPRGLRRLEQTLQQRLKSAPEGSYTKRLFEDETLLRDKLVEEAQELSEAQEPSHVAEELADLLYFAVTRATKAGVSMDDAIAALDRRTRKVTRRKGDSKAFRIAAGQEILQKPKEES